jgi:hypothetical protein
MSIYEVDQAVAERKKRMRRMKYAKDTGKLMKRVD